LIGATDDQDDEQNITGDETQSASRAPPGENIADYGAKPNPGDPGLEQAKQNLEAISDAAHAAGEMGTIYVPPGTYYFGYPLDTASPYLFFGAREPAGISIVGAGPERSTLGITGHASPGEQQIQTGFVYDDEVDHGTVALEQIRLDGNYENIGNLSAVGGGSRGVDTGDQGEFSLFNVHIRGWHLAGLRGKGGLQSVMFCTFEDNGIKRHNETGGESISHHVVCRPNPNAQLDITNCYFRDCAGSAINVRFNDGTIRVHNCYAEGTGANLCKLSAGKLLEMRNVFHKANTKSLERKIANRPGKYNFWGRNFIQSLGERGKQSVTVRTEHVKTCGHNDYAFQSRDNYDQGPASIMWRGDMIAFHNTCRIRDNEVIRSKAGGGFENVDIGRISIHDANGVVFDVPDADGNIDTLRYSETNGLGDAGRLTIDAEMLESAAYQPIHPSRADVGINSFVDRLRPQ
jgi:hypothetical protein